jgi:hypothetical protein
MDKLANVRLIELRDDPAHIRMITQRFHTRENLAQQPNADIGHPLFSVPALNRFEISDGRLGESNDEPGHVCLEGYFKPRRAFASTRDRSRPASTSARPATTARMNARSSSANSYSDSD